MVTIVKAAPHPSVVKEVVCRSCGATLSYTPNEVKNYIDCDYGGGRELVKYIDCPSCGKDVVVN